MYKSYHEQNYPCSIDVKITWEDSMTHTDSIKGLNEGHALHRAAWNWPDAEKIEKI